MTTTATTAPLFLDRAALHVGDASRERDGFLAWFRSALAVYGAAKRIGAEVDSLSPLAQRDAALAWVNNHQ
jgi:hypothetical protein